MQTEWKTLKNELPQHGTLVLITISDLEEGSARYVGPGCFYGEEEGWTAFTAQGELPLDDIGSFEVVGWTPLPEPMQES